MGEKRTTDDEIAREYLDNKDDMTRWNVGAARKIRSRRGKGPSTIFSLRLTGEELVAFSEYARAHGTTVSDFLRQAAKGAIAGETDAKAVASPSSPSRG
jgi:hypothetical protein